MTQIGWFLFAWDTTVGVSLFWKPLSSVSIHRNTSVYQFQMTSNPCSSVFLWVQSDVLKQIWFGYCCGSHSEVTCEVASQDLASIFWQSVENGSWCYEQ